jgi:hypothetical protein
MNDNRKRRFTMAPPRRGMAVYMYVTTAALMVSLLALSATAVVRVERRQVDVFGDRQTARTLAHSAVDLALKRIDGDSNWRSSYTSGVATTPSNVLNGSTDSVSWSFYDTDGNLTDADIQLRIKGVGRSGDAVQVASVQLQRDNIGPVTHRSLTSSGSNDSLRNDKWWGQYFRPTLPADAFQWWVTSVEFYIRRDNSNRTFRVRLYRPDGGNLPSSEILDEVALNSDSFSLLWGWRTITFTGAYMLNSADGVCLTLETTASSDPIDLEYVAGGVSAANSALLRGTPTWSAPETDKGLRYRVYGYYTSASAVQPVTGTWLWDSP